MQNSFLGIAAAIIGLSVLIIIHELGHFVAAKLLGVDVDEFTIGYGPKIFSKKIRQTTYGIGAVPLGGYVKIEEVKPEEISLTETDLPILGDLPWYKRFLILISGPASNIVFSIILLSLVFVSGIPVASTTIKEISKGSAAEAAGLLPRDTIIAIDGDNVKDWGGAVQTIKTNPNQSIEIRIARGKEIIEKSIILGEKDGAGFLGVTMELVIKRLPLYKALPLAAVSILNYTAQTIRLIFQYITSSIPKGIDLKFIGPVGFTSELSEGAKESMLIYFQILAQMGVGLAVANLFPIPPLDGGKLILLGAEGIRRKPFKARTILLFQAAGLFLLLSLILIVTFLDIFGRGA